MRRQDLLGWCLLVAALMASGLMYLLADPHREQGQRLNNVTRAQAEVTLDRVVELVRRHKLDRLCKEFAGAPATCRSLISSAELMGRYPGQVPPTVIGAKRTRLGLTLQLRVTDSAPEPFTADFPVIRDYHGNLVALYPIYWSGVNTVSRPGG